MLVFVDESLRQSATGLSVVTAVVISPDDLAEAQYQLRGLLLRGQVRFHWRDESEPRREQMVRVLSGMTIAGICYLVRDCPARHLERARAISLTRMLWDLKRDAPTRLTIESRRELDRRDTRTISAARKSGHYPERMKFDFLPPANEPLLWAADAIAGVVSAHAAGEDSRHFHAMPAGKVQLVELTL